MRKDKVELKRENWCRKRKFICLFAAVPFVLLFFIANGMLYDLCDSAGKVVGFDGRYLFLLVGILIYILAVIIFIRMMYINCKCLRSS